MSAGLERLGFRVVAPLFRRVVDGTDTTFPVLDSDDRSKSPRELEHDFLEAIGLASLHVTVNIVGGRIGRSATAEYAYAAVHGRPNAVTTTSKIVSRGYPEIWFDGVSSVEEAALERLPWFEMDWTYTADNTQAVSYIERTRPLPVNHPDRSLLVGIYERLLIELPNTPVDPN